ncbi:L-alanine dehydrogenase [Cyclonatronum proteinivorum]|uniref:alanine dehydrogenase n=1 Tax=Cyclonatronum proteinivorum TaxID=1457365 RepID=A0A345UK07_9BACT|nr:alanine dehydrogenase [Cyclonatronum proteinivorum]AXJ00809.1 L-alanine dehydrogenase [Cyclonatronum proteinivorum]
MEILNPDEFTQRLGLETLEKTLKKENGGISLKIGFPKERSNDENRVSVTPGGVSVLIANGHEVFIERGAGEGANFSDTEYSEAGAAVCDTAREVFRRCEMIVKVAPPVPDELEHIESGQIVLSAIHLGNADKLFFQTLIQKGITGVGFEFMQLTDGSFPIVRMLHEITGSMSVQIAAHYLESYANGQGVMLGGISGIPPATVVILGAGTIAEYAARTALGYGAQVYVMDNDLSRLRHLENALNRRIITMMANHQYLSSATRAADVIIGAAMVEGHRAPCMVTEQMVESMKPGSVIVDTVIDQGGCVATSRPTRHTSPVFQKHDVIHYCVPNIPSGVARTSTYALNNVVVPFLLEIGDEGGFAAALWSNHSLRSGTYVYKKNLTKKSLSRFFDIPFRDIEMLIASRI